MYQMKKSSIANYFMRAAIIMYYSYFFINNSYYRSFFNIKILFLCTYTTTVIFSIVSVLLKKVLKTKVFIITVLMICLCCFVGIKSEDMANLIVVVLLVIAGSMQEERSILRFCFIVNSFWLSTIVISAKFGIIENASRIYVGHGTRVFLGFTAHIGQVTLLYCLLTFIAYKKEKIKVWQLVAFEVANIYLFMHMDVKASFYLIHVIIALVLLYPALIKRKILDSVIFKMLAILILPSIILVTFALPLLYKQGNDIALALNSLISGRIQLEARLMEIYSIRPLGQILVFNQEGSYNNAYFYIDSSYVKYLYMYGFILWGVVMIGYEKLVIELYNKRKYYMLLAVLIELVYFSTGTQLFNIVYNSFLLLIIPAFQSDKKHLIVNEEVICEK